MFDPRLGSDLYRPTYCATSENLYYSISHLLGNLSDSSPCLTETNCKLPIKGPYLAAKRTMCFPLNA